MKRLVSLFPKNDWLPFLKEEFEKTYFKNLELFLEKEWDKGTVVFPEKANIFKAFELTPLNDIKVVILGQDPYHGDGQAHGLAFSVPPQMPLPPSLKNIYKELREDLKLSPPSHGHLEAWARSGVFLLNTVLTVEKAKAASHQKKGWEEFTNRVIEVISEQKDGVVFVLWGGHAAKKAKLIDEKKHQIIKDPHPSPLSAYRGFFGSKPFSKANNLLKKQGIAPVDWNLPKSPSL